MSKVKLIYSIFRLRCKRLKRSWAGADAAKRFLFGGAHLDCESQPLVKNVVEWGKGYAASEMFTISCQKVVEQGGGCACSSLLLLHCKSSSVLRGWAKTYSQSVWGPLGSAHGHGTMPMSAESLLTLNTWSSLRSMLSLKGYNLLSRSNVAEGRF